MATSIKSTDNPHSGAEISFSSTTSHNNTERDANNDDVLEDVDDVLWDQRSDFFKLSHTGYREGVLGDFQSSEKDGRIAGFLAASQARPSVNPTIFLSRLDGLLTACLLKLKETLSEEQKKEAHTIRADINKILISVYNPSNCILQEFSSRIKLENTTGVSKTTGHEGDIASPCDCSDKECGNVKKSRETVEPECINIFTRIKTFCYNVGWKIPSFITDEEDSSSLI